MLTVHGDGDVGVVGSYDDNNNMARVMFSWVDELKEERIACLDGVDETVVKFMEMPGKITRNGKRGMYFIVSASEVRIIALDNHQRNYRKETAKEMWDELIKLGFTRNV